MLNFTSALYLGLRHPNWSLRPWTQFTLGAPAALSPPPGANAVAQQLAILQGCEAATLGPSTLHLFWDWFGTLPKDSAIVYVDAGVYPIVSWGIERAAARGACVRRFAHYNPNALRCLLKRSRLGQRRPIIVADGFCPACGRPAPVRLYLECARIYGGCLLLDDTQALGILGSQVPNAPYGLGGGGSLRWCDARGPDVLLISSLAKGLGVPLAALSGGIHMVESFEEKSETRVYCSPPSIAVTRAAAHALIVNQAQGDKLRLRLAQLVHHFRRRLQEAGLSAVGGLFPVQTLRPTKAIDTTMLYEMLSENGIRTVLRRGPNEASPRISFLITAQHKLRDLDSAVDALAQAVSRAACLTSTREINHEQPVQS